MIITKILLCIFTVDSAIMSTRKQFEPSNNGVFANNNERIYIELSL